MINQFVDVSNRNGYKSIQFINSFVSSVEQVVKLISNTFFTMANFNFVFFMVFVVLFTGNSAFKLQPKIINGSSTSAGQFPFYAQLSFYIDSERELICGGSLITDVHILTAAHCTINSLMAAVILGYRTMNDLSGTQKFIVFNDEFYVNPDFDIEEIPNDLAILRLPQKVQFTSNVHPIKLAVRGFDEFVDVIAIGSGAIKPHKLELPSTLQYTELKTIPVNMCLKFYPFLTNVYDVMCVWSVTERSIYQGDSGLIKRYQVWR